MRGFPGRLAGPQTPKDTRLARARRMAGLPIANGAAVCAIWGGRSPIGTCVSDGCQPTPTCVGAARLSPYRLSGGTRHAARGTHLTRQTLVPRPARSLAQNKRALVYNGRERGQPSDGKIKPRGRCGLILPMQRDAHRSCYDTPNWRHKPAPLLGSLGGLTIHPVLIS